MVRKPWVRAVRFAAVAGMAVFAAAGAAAPVRGTSPAPPAHTRDVSLAEYRAHLEKLSTLVAACAKDRDLLSCDPAKVSEDDRVPLGSEKRLVRYGWLRVLIAKAAVPDKPEDKKGSKDQKGKAAKTAPAGQSAPPGENALPPPLTTSELLQMAHTRLTGDIAQADGLAAASMVRLPPYTRERNTMKQVLEGKEFRGLQEPSVRDRLMEKLARWLNSLFAGASHLRLSSPWVGRLVKVGFILGVCVALVWGLLQMERRWRVRLVPLIDGPTPGAASARDWQLWLEDARKAAAESRWREAIHFVYWAAISRLESRRMWPADRARTPREYLALVAENDPRRPGLAQLTGSFERTWYGGRVAAEQDYRRAEQVAAALIGGSGSGSARGGAR